MRRPGRCSRWMLAAGLLALSTGSHLATQLVYMRHGRVLRVQTVQHEGDWLMLTLQGGNVLGLPVQAVGRIEDDLERKGDEDTALNVVTSGRYVPPTPGAGPPVAPEPDIASEEVPDEVPSSPPPQIQAPDTPASPASDLSARRSRFLGARTRPGSND